MIFVCERIHRVAIQLEVVVAPHQLVRVSDGAIGLLAEENKNKNLIYAYEKRTFNFADFSFSQWELKRLKRQK